MKRILSLTLALVMVLGTFTGVFAAEPTVEEAAGKFLETKGILLGDDNGNLMLKDNLERRDAVILLSRLLGVEEVAAEFPTSEESPSWTDVRTDAYYVPFFAWAEANGYFEGNEDNTFAPRAAISAPEYALVLLRALGYEVNGHESWKAALETAKEAGLLEDVEVKFEDKVVRGQMAVMTLNALKANVKGTDETLAEKLGIELPEDPKAKELTAEVNDTENLAEVVVELSNAELADTIKLENPSNYRLNNQRTVKSAKVVGDDVVLLVDVGENETNALVKGREYTLTIRNIDRAINKDYKFKAFDNTVPTVESVEVLGEYGIKVTTSEPVEKPAERNFLIDGKRTSMIVEQYGRDIILTPYHNRSFDKDAKELEILELRDFAGYRSTAMREEIEVIKDEAAPEVVSSTVAGNKVTVVFDKDIRKGSVAAYSSTRDLGNASYVERRITLYADKAEKVDTNKVVYTFKEELPRNVELTIEGVENHSKVAMERTKITPVLVANEYAAVITNNDKRHVLRVSEDVYTGKVYDGELTLTIKFDENIDKNSIETTKDEDGNVISWDNFVLYEKEVSNRGKRTQGKVTNAKVDGKEVIVTLKDLTVNNSDKDYDYILEVNNLKDQNGNRIFRDYIDFEVLHTASSFKVVKENKDGEWQLIFRPGRNTTEFSIAFSHAVDKDAALDARNYFFVAKDKTMKALDELDGYVIVESNGNVVTLVVPETYSKLTEEYENIEILPRVTRLNGERLEEEDRTLNILTDFKLR